jgi:hypothetical protein
MLGGTRASERKKPGRKQNTPSTWHQVGLKNIKRE